jgi:tetratricopeptide (TPR) repeat protein
VDLVIDCYRLAAKEGVTEAYNNIGVFYTMTGKVDKAVPFFMEAANAGLATGLTNMMGYYGMLEDNEHMMEYVKKLADIGDAAGMWNYALAYHFGYIGRKPDISKAKDMYQRLLTLPFREGKVLSDETEIMLLKIKTMACYNLAQILYLSEEPNDENLCGIIRLLEETPYVIIDNKKIKDLKEEIYQGYGVEYKYH